MEPQDFSSQTQPRLDCDLQRCRFSARENSYRQGREGRSEQDYVTFQGGFQDSFGGFQPGQEGGEEEVALGADVGVDLDDSLDGLAAGELYGTLFFSCCGTAGDEGWGVTGPVDSLDDLGLGHYGGHFGSLWN